jgi:type I restriction enzyme M protein
VLPTGAIQSPAILRRLIDELVGRENWSSMEADVKGDIYEGLLSRSAEESPGGPASTSPRANSSRRSWT